MSNDPRTGYNAVENQYATAIERECSVVDHISCDAAAPSRIANLQGPATDRGAPAVSIVAGQDQRSSAA